MTVHRIPALDTIEGHVLVLQERRKRMYQDRGAAVLDRNVSETNVTEMLEMFGLDAEAARVAQAVETSKEEHQMKNQAHDEDQDPDQDQDVP